MKLFKYKSIIGDGLLHALDAMVNERIYLSTCDCMNDPDEGQWETIFSIPTDIALLSADVEGNRNIIDSTHEIVKSVRFTSFSAICTNPLLWAHYAGGFGGLAFEYDFDDGLEIKKINYSGKPRIEFNSVKDIANKNKVPQDVGILLGKEPCWEYESEYRLFENRSAPNKYIALKPTRVIFGIKDSEHSRMLAAIAKKCDIATAYLKPYAGNEYRILYI